MSRALSVLVIGFAVAMTVVPIGAEAQEEQPVRTLLTSEWPPFTSEAYFAPYLSYGRAADVVVSALDAVEVESRIEFDHAGFGDAYELVVDEEVDAAFPYYKTEQRQRETIFSKEPLFTVTEVIFYDKELAPDLGQSGSLDEMRQVLESDGVDFRESARFVEFYCYHQEVDDAFGRDCTAEDDRNLESDLHAFKALANDRNVLMLPSAREVGERILRTWLSDERDRIGIVEGLQWQREVFLVAPKSSAGQALVDAFDKGLDKIKRSSRYDTLINAPLPEEAVLRTVRLSDPGTFPLVVARKTRESEETVVLPRGTDAMVVQWSRNFLIPQKTTLQEQLNEMSLVMITNGPQRGQLLWVKNVFIELERSP